MHNFGKMILKKIPIEHAYYKFLGMYFDQNGVEWHENYKSKRAYKIYAMVQDDGYIVSWQEDPEQSQADGIDIYGFTGKEARKRGDHTHFINGKFCTITPKDGLGERIAYLEQKLKEVLEILNGITNTGRRDGTNDCAGCSNCIRSL